MSKTVLSTPSAPGALGPYSVAVEAAGLVFVSGQVAIDPTSGNKVASGVADEARQVLDNIRAILTDVDLSMDDIAKTTIFLADIKDFGIVNEVYAGFFEDAPPARSTVQAGALPGGFLVEIEVVASR